MRSDRPVVWKGGIIAPYIIGDAEHLSSLSTREVYELDWKKGFILERSLLPQGVHPVAERIPVAR